MKIELQNKQDQEDILATMDCVARQMGVRGLALQNKLNCACFGSGCNVNKKVEIPNSAKKKIRKKVAKKKDRKKR